MTFIDIYGNGNRNSQELIDIYKNRSNEITLVFLLFYSRNEAGLFVLIGIAVVTKEKPPSEVAGRPLNFIQAACIYAGFY